MKFLCFTYIKIYIYNSNFVPILKKWKLHKPSVEQSETQNFSKTSAQMDLESHNIWDTALSDTSQTAESR